MRDKWDPQSNFEDGDKWERYTQWQRENARRRVRLFSGYSQAKPSVGMVLSAINWGIVAGFVALMLLFGAALWQGNAQIRPWAALGFVLVGFVFSVCLHEFTHAVAAVFGGDNSASTARYLSFNPLLYVHPVLSIVLPIIFVLAGGLPLPGGAVYLRRDLIRSRTWQSIVSLSAPCVNLLIAAVLALPIRFGLLDEHPTFLAAVALLAFLNAVGFALNLLPIPPLDGFGGIAPWLPRDIANAAYSVSNVSFILIYLAFAYIQPLNDWFFQGIFNLMRGLGVSPVWILFGYAETFFWQGR